VVPLTTTQARSSNCCSHSRLRSKRWAHNLCVSNVCGDHISFREWEKHGAQSQPAPFPPNHSAPRHPIGLIPEEPTEAHKPRRDFNRAVHRTIYRVVQWLVRSRISKASRVSKTPKGAGWKAPKVLRVLIMPDGITGEVIGRDRESGTVGRFLRTQHRHFLLLRIWPVLRRHTPTPGTDPWRGRRPRE